LFAAGQAGVFAEWLPVKLTPQMAAIPRLRSLRPRRPTGANGYSVEKLAMRKLDEKSTAQNGP
jgi:hypothetical protein